jgi:hypothetical protein
MNDRKTKTFIAALAKMTPKERAAAWRKLSYEECATAWVALTPEERKADTGALEIAAIEEAGPDIKQQVKETVEARKRLASKGLVVEAGRRNGQVVHVHVEHATPAQIGLIPDEPTKQRALGASAFHRARTATENPYPADTPAQQFWHQGFCTARDCAGRSVQHSQEQMQGDNALEIEGAPELAVFELRDGKYWDGEPVVRYGTTTPPPDGFYVCTLTSDGYIVKDDSGGDALVGPYATAAEAERMTRKLLSVALSPEEKAWERFISGYSKSGQAQILGALRILLRRSTN